MLALPAAITRGISWSPNCWPWSLAAGTDEKELGCLLTDNRDYRELE
jgi:hypothetical protein